MNFLGAKWIYNSEYTSADNRCVYFYKDFEVSSEIKSAYIYAASTDAFRLYLNSGKVNGNYFENHGITYIKQIPLYKYDIKDMLSDKNSICAVLGSVKRKLHCSDFLFYAVVDIEYTDGSTEKIVTDESWETSFGQLFSASFQDGEKYDFTAGSFKRRSAHVNTDKKGHTYLLSKAYAPGLYAENSVKPKSSGGGNAKLFDAGSVVLGVISVKLKGKKGEKVKIRYSETAEFSDRCCDELTLSGGEDVFSNEFIYKNFRYAEASGSAEILSFEVCTLSYNIERNGDFYCSNSKINEAYFENIQRRSGKLNDYKMMISDAEANLLFDIFSFDCREYIEAALSSCRASQAENGCIPVASRRGLQYRYGIFENATLLPIELVYRHYIMFGDIGIVRDNIDMCRKIIDFVDEFSESENLEFILKTIHSAELMSRLCSFIGSPDEAYYKKLYQSLYTAAADGLNLRELSADILALLYEYRFKTPAELKDAVLMHSYKEVSPHKMSSWLGLLYECGKFEEPYKIITSDDFDKTLCRDWLFSGCLGIRPEETADGAGFKKVIIQPAIDLSYSIKKASGGYITPYGKISVFWEKTDDMYTCCLTVPYEIDATCRFNGFKVVNQKSSRETYVFLLRRN